MLGQEYTAKSGLDTIQVAIKLRKFFLRYLNIVYDAKFPCFSIAKREVLSSYMFHVRRTHSFGQKVSEIIQQFKVCRK